MASQPVQYAAGLPFARSRRLSCAEQTWLKRRIRRLIISVAVMVTGLILWVVATGVVAHVRPQLAEQLGGPFGLWLGSAGVAGGLAALWRGGWVRIPVGLCALYLLGLAAVGALVPELTERPSGVTRLVVAAGIALGTSVVVATVARRLRMLAALSRVRHDIEHGVVERFEGLTPGPSTALRRLKARGYGPAIEGARMQLDVLPRSGLVVRAAGRRCAPWTRVFVAQVARTQPHALRVELPEGVAPTQTAGRLNLQRRSLSPQERDELDRHIVRLRRHPWGAVVATMGLALAGWWQLRGGVPESGWALARRLLDPMMLGWYALATLTVVAYARRTIAARKLDDDRRLRWVVTVDGVQTPQGQSPPRLEVLPVSQLAWTENENPATWRTSKL